MAEESYVFPFELPANVPTRYRAPRYRHGLPHVTVVERGCSTLARGINTAFKLASKSMDNRIGVGWQAIQATTNEAIDRVLIAARKLKKLIAEQKAMGLLTYEFPVVLEEAISSLTPFRE